MIIHLAIQKFRLEKIQISFRLDRVLKYTWVITKCPCYKVSLNELAITLYTVPWSEKIVVNRVCFLLNIFPWLWTSLNASSCQRCPAKDVLPKTSCQKRTAKYVLTMMFCQMCPYKGVLPQSVLPKVSCQWCPSNGVLPKVSCQRHSAKGVLPKTFCQRCPVKGILPKVSCKRHSAKDVLPKASCQWCPDTGSW